MSPSIAFLLALILGIPLQLLPCFCDRLLEEVVTGMAHTHTHALHHGWRLVLDINVFPGHMLTSPFCFWQFLTHLI